MSKKKAKKEVKAAQGWLVKSPSGKVLEIVEIHVENHWVPQWKNPADALTGKPADTYHKAGTTTYVTVLKGDATYSVEVPSDEELVIKASTHEVVWRKRK